MNKMMKRLMGVMWYVYRNWHLVFSKGKCMRVTFSHGFDVPGWVYAIDEGNEIVSMGKGWFKIV